MIRRESSFARSIEGRAVDLLTIFERANQVGASAQKFIYLPWGGNNPGIGFERLIMMEYSDLGERIREIKLPDGVSWWPPAPGWWLLAGLILLAVVAGIALYRRRALRRAALRELDRLRREYQSIGDPSALAAGLSKLLRRVTLARARRTAVAGLRGEAWLGHLDRTGRTRDFSSGPGRVLHTLPYSGEGEVEASALLSLARRWIRRNTR